VLEIGGGGQLEYLLVWYWFRLCLLLLLLLCVGPIHWATSLF